MNNKTKRNEYSGERPRVRFDLTTWEALSDIARRVDVSVPDLIVRIGARSPGNFAAGARDFVVDYYRQNAAKRWAPAKAK